MNFVVDGTPERCADKVEAYFHREWPYGGGVKREGTTVRCTVKIEGSGLRSLVDLLLAIITAGLWLIWMLIRPIDFHQVRVFASEESSNKTHLAISASHDKYKKAMAEWVQRELVENRAAASGKTPSTEKGKMDAASEDTDIPGKIRKLADLRDAGAITDEEFEAKKADLLGRM